MNRTAPEPVHSGARSGFTLIELMISVLLLSLVMLFLYQTLSSLTQANNFYEEKLDSASQLQKISKVLYLDLMLSEGNVSSVNIDRMSDAVMMQTAHSVHRRILPFVGYLVRDGILYRIESSQQLAYPLGAENEMVVDNLGPVKTFRLYASKEHYLVDFRQDDTKKVLFKVRALNR